MNSEIRETDILIVGAGIAGASTAFHLTSSFEGNILVVERESGPGRHASGRNAGMIVQATRPDAIRRLIVRSRQFYQQFQSEVGFFPSGSLLLGSVEDLEGLRDPNHVYSEYLRPEKVRAEFPPLGGHEFEAALSTPSDGVVDLETLLSYYVGGASQKGALFRYGVGVERIDQADSGFLVGTSIGEIRCRRLVNAAGAWAGEIGGLAGAREIPLTPFKRHLSVLEDILEVRRDQPFIWDISAGFYFRPYAEGVLFCICDQEPSANLEPVVDDEISERMAETIWKYLPAFSEASQSRIWCCFRTATPDGHFVIGPDPAIENFFWVAGLGGQGIGSSWALGELAAALIKGETREAAQPFSPARFPVPDPAYSHTGVSSPDV